MFPVMLRNQKDLLSEVSPLQIAAYLRANGWQERRHESDRSATWILRPEGADTDDYYEALLPLRPDFRDFMPRMAELFHVLEQAEQRSQEEIIDSLSVTNADVINLRLLGDSVATGSIPFSESVRLSQRAWDMMQAAACSAVSPRGVYSTRKPDKVKRYLEQVRAGQTKKGSYTATIISPVEPDLFLSPDGEEPFERRVLRFLFEGLETIRDAVSVAASQNNAAPFEEGIGHGVSANLCEAVADLAEAGGDGFEVTCAWSQSRRPPVGISPKIFLPRDIEPYVRVAARNFRANSIIEDAEVHGFVERTNRRTGAISGKILIVGYADGQPRRVQTTLAGDLYQQAVVAHKEDRAITCFGTVARQGRTYVLTNLHGFHIDI